MTYNLDEKALIQSAQRGELNAFNQVIDLYQDPVFRVAYRMLGDADTAADAAQSTWITAFRKLNEFRGGQFRSWLMRILVNTCYDELRRRHRRGEVALFPVNDEGDEFASAEWLRDPTPGVEAQVDARETAQAINTALQSLPEVYRSMLVLVDLEGLGYEEAAATMHVPLGTVRSRVARGRMAIRRQLAAAAANPPLARNAGVSFPQQSEPRRS